MAYPKRRTPREYKRRTTAILEALRNGNTRRAAAPAGGINHTTLSKWISEDEKLRDAVEDAEAHAERAHVSNINRAIQERGDVEASKFWLERRRPNDWGRIDRVDVLLREQQLTEIADQLTQELGRQVTVAELRREYEGVLKALPAPSRRRSNG